MVKIDFTHKRIITAALTGAGNLKEQNPNIPYTPDEFADTVEKCYKAGASVVHIHGRDPDFKIGKGTPPFSFKLEHYEAVLTAVKKRVPNIIINISTGGRGSPEERIRSIPTANQSDISNKSCTGITEHMDLNIMLSDISMQQAPMRNTARITPVKPI